MRGAIWLAAICLAAFSVAGAQDFSGAAPSSGEEGQAAASRIEKARKLLASGAAGEAVALLQEAVAAEPDNAEARLLLGSALALVPRPSEALAELRRAVELRPDSAPAHNALGMALGRFAQPHAARKAFEKAVELDPGFAQAQVNLALILAQQGDFAEAGERLDRAIRIHGDSPPAPYWRYLRGKVYTEQNQMAEAAREFKIAAELRPDYAEAYFALGAARDHLGELAAAVQAFEAAVRHNPQNAAARYRLAKAYLRERREEKALEHLRKAEQLAPRDRSILYALQRTLRIAGREDEAREVKAKLAKVLEESNESKQNALRSTELNNQGVELEKAGDLQAARRKYAAALELAPFHGGYRRNLGLVLCRLGRWEEGIAELREAVRNNPDDAGTLRALYSALDQAPEGAAPSAEDAIPER